MTEVTVERHRWYRGQKQGSMLLRNQDNKMCCLGFAALACGLGPKQIRGIPTPAAVSGAEAVPVWLNLITKGVGETLTLVTKEMGETLTDSPLCLSLMGANDSEYTSDAVKEELIAEEGLNAGLKFVFVD